MQPSVEKPALGESKVSQTPNLLDVRSGCSISCLVLRVRAWCELLANAVTWGGGDVWERDQTNATWTIRQALSRALH